MRAATLLVLSLFAGCDYSPCSYGLPTSPATSCPAGTGGGGGGPPRRLSFSVQPSGAPEGAAITPGIQVRFLNPSGDLASNVTDSVTISIATNPGSGTLSGRTTVLAASGVATFPNLSIDRRGEAYTLTATAATAALGFAPAVSSAFNVTCTCWSRRAPMPTGRYEMGVGVVNGVVYAIGGQAERAGLADAILETVEAYDPVTNSWSTRAPMPTPRSALAVGVVNGVLYAVGGRDFISGNPNSVGYHSLETVEAYDPVTDRWTAKAPMPTSRGSLGVGVVNGVLYAVGGYDASFNTLTSVEAYDPVADVWTTKTPMPTPHQMIGVGVVNGLLYAVDGGTVGAYDPVANTWTTKTPMPTPRYLFGVGVVNGVLYALGGSNGNALATVEAYDPDANSWTSSGPMLTSRVALGVGVVNGSVYVVGGTAEGRGSLPTLEAYDPARDR